MEKTSTVLTKPRYEAMGYSYYIASIRMFNKLTCHVVSVDRQNSINNILINVMVYCLGVRWLLEISKITIYKYKQGFSLAPFERHV